MCLKDLMQLAPNAAGAQQAFFDMGHYQPSSRQLCVCLGGGHGAPSCLELG